VKLKEDYRVGKQQSLIQQGGSLDGQCLEDQEVVGVCEAEDWGEEWELEERDRNLPLTVCGGFLIKKAI
jgi:hypothetical protein